MKGIAEKRVQHSRRGISPFDHRVCQKLNVRVPIAFDRRTRKYHLVRGEEFSERFGRIIISGTNRSDIESLASAVYQTTPPRSRYSKLREIPIEGHARKYPYPSQGCPCVGQVQFIQRSPFYKRRSAIIDSSVRRTNRTGIQIGN